MTGHGLSPRSRAPSYFGYSGVRCTPAPNRVSVEGLRDGNALEYVCLVGGDSMLLSWRYPGPG
eukprot:NODE_16155_length_1009_cov_4.609977.p7 GENE.NODE_16155_length_1009_cov_4.609977~~NODE_16155_length_1009_cov_4.609977.p7  ORF type:complete len:63 (+),score=9.92 NODE_16155_length_1009_cov_4.609977:284-472(+)